MGDILIRSFSLSRAEDIVEDRPKKRTLEKWFLSSFSKKRDSISLACTLLTVASLEAYFLTAFHFIHDGVHLITTLVSITIPALMVGFCANMLARLRTERTFLNIVRPLWLLTYPFRLIADPIITLELRIRNFLRTDDDEADADEREDIIAAVSDGEHDGYVEEAEREMIENILELKDSYVSDIMTPRTDLCCLECTETIANAIQLATERGYSRIPVFVESRDNIQGIFYVKDALAVWGRKDANPPALTEIMRTPYFIPESKRISELMSELQAKKMHMAIVLDEYGGTAGLVTIEDIVEEIVGEIQDEYDHEALASHKELQPGVYDVEGRMHVDEVNDILDDDIIPESDDYDTLAGFILDQLGRLPETGEHVYFNTLRLTVLEADERRIARLRIEVLPEETVAAS